MSGNPQPVIILVHPQMGENIGMCARAMLNCGLSRLRLVAPRDGWPQDSARATAADADPVIDGAEVFATLEEAIADCTRVFATTARERAHSTPVMAAQEAAEEISGLKDASTTAILFGPEASGLDSDSVAQADTLLRFPTNPGFPSLNLAQAVLLFGWEWRRAGSMEIEVGGEEPAVRGELDSFLRRVEEQLSEKGFFLTEEMKPHSLRTLRSIFTKTKATEQELKFLHGMLTALTKSK
jgi:tRNA/rRNA methyltransferase